MPKWSNHLFIILILAGLVLGIAGCSTPLPWSATSPSDSTGEINPEWTFPSGNNETAPPLPDLAHVVAEVMPSVVSVTTERVVSGFWSQYTETTTGSGVVIDPQGYVVTNSHVVENARDIKVELANSKTFPADIVGTDSLTDSAVLKIDSANLPYARWGDSSSLSVGDWVVAIGNALGEGITATHGIVSRLDVSVTVSGNTLRGLIQTDAAINPGNSGGPLVNMGGEIVGITSVKIAAVGVEGMGYAISSNSAEPIIEDLIHQGYVTRPWLGVQVSTVDKFVSIQYSLSIDHGAMITMLVADSPAAYAGLKEEDVIIWLENKEITNADDLVQAIHDCQIGQEVEITFVRGEDTKATWAKLSENPKS